jgi:hypothetical protein
MASLSFDEALDKFDEDPDYYTEGKNLNITPFNENKQH